MKQDSYMSSQSNYIKLIDRFWIWTQNINRELINGSVPFIDRRTLQSVRAQLLDLANMVKDEYPFFSDELLGIASVLFGGGIGSSCSINPAAFGELFIIIKNLKIEPFNLALWNTIHPRIKNSSFGLYADGHFGPAAEKAIKEVEQRLRDIFNQVRPTSVEPKEATEIVGALLSENGAYPVSNWKTPSEKSYGRGVKLLFEGFLSSYRNPISHGNRDISKQEAVEQISLASQLMHVLDKGSANLQTARDQEV
ncbi:MAG: TIGR02391 family protein [Enterorhabdus sp.]|jgi:uncharacterized protein (TIGR02391 family)|nr:TIGR02391 family protein [Enterorhabdus sp.]